MSNPSGHAVSTDREWLEYQHNWLDARLAAVFMKLVWGARHAAHDELATYRLEWEGHVSRARLRLFPALAVLDARTLTAEGRDWTLHTEDVQQAARAVQLALRCSDGGAFEAFGVLRRAVRRQWAGENRLLDMSDTLEHAVPPAAVEPVPSLA